VLDHPNHKLVASDASLQRLDALLGGPRHDRAAPLYPLTKEV
jgi:hypothetical protein